jgi:hypothetical protein
MEMSLPDRRDEQQASDLRSPHLRPSNDVRTIGFMIRAGSNARFRPIERLAEQGRALRAAPSNAPDDGKRASAPLR